MKIIRRVANLISISKHVIVLTGAGMSAESGIPTFRGDDGLWKKYDPMELATYESFIRDPKRVWEWYKWRMNIIMKAKPHTGYYILAKWEKNGFIKGIITQNVDGMHLRAGSRNVIELHGNIFRVKCISCNHKKELNEPPRDVPPKCPQCGSNLRPDVVWFGEPLDPNIISLTYNLATNSDLFIVIGTSGIVYPAAQLPYIAKQHGANVIEINVEETPISNYADYKLRMKASIALESINDYLTRM